MHSIKLCAALLAAVTLNACAPAPKVAWESGARKAWIVKSYTPDTPREQLPACLAALPPHDLATHHYVQVRYRHVRRMHVTAAELPDSVQAVDGDEVELWPEDCSIGAVSRITKLLPAASQ
ncbi:hypothetical protein AAKU55_005571 [Oxalobacteraceae bacterium GrIS 1.11]